MSEMTQQQLDDDDVRHVAALAVQGKLPLIHMQVVDDGLALHAAGDEPYPWKATADEHNRLRVWVGHGLPIIADVTVHRSGDEGISDEIQHIATGLVLSGLRACAVREEARRREEAAARPQQRSGAEGGE